MSKACLKTCITLSTRTVAHSLFLSLSSSRSFILSWTFLRQWYHSCTAQTRRLADSFRPAELFPKCSQVDRQAAVVDKVVVAAKAVMEAKAVMAAITIMAEVVSHRPRGRGLVLQMHPGARSWTFHSCLTDPERARMDLARVLGAVPGVMVKICSPPRALTQLSQGHTPLRLGPARVRNAFNARNAAALLGSLLNFRSTHGKNNQKTSMFPRSMPVSCRFAAYRTSRLLTHRFLMFLFESV